MKKNLGIRANVVKRVVLRIGEDKRRNLNSLSLNPFNSLTAATAGKMRQQNVKTEDLNDNYDICVYYQGNICVFMSAHKSTMMLMFQDRKAGTICVYLGGDTAERVVQ